MSKTILVVIVLYKKHPLQSETISSLKRSVTHSPRLPDLLDIMLWDNSPYAIDQGSLPIACEYVFAGRNACTSGPTITPWKLRSRGGFHGYCCWTRIRPFRKNPSCACLHTAPNLKSGWTLDPSSSIHPAHTDLWFLRDLWTASFGCHRFHRHSAGSASARRTELTVGSLMRVASLREIGGYSDDFWLDLSDIYVFRAMYSIGSHL